MTALPMPSTSARRPRGFTLVELLVVVAIIAMLAALVTPAVIRARSAARNAAIDTEIDLLHMAIMTYRNEYGSFPPCNSDLTATGRAGRHIARLFPRCSDITLQLGSTAVSPETALRAWLRGYTNDPMNPVSGAGGRKPLFDFDQSRLSSGAYAPPGRPNSPYVYIDSTAYGSVDSPTQFVVGTGTYRAQFQVISSSTVFFNPDTFQILCAGQNGEWRNGDSDDLSNFWRGTKAQHEAANQ